MVDASKIKILPATKRTIPRPFAFEWAKGNVIEEASIRCKLQDHSWEPTLQLLRYDDGEETLRFCVLHGKRFSRSPLLISPLELAALLYEAAKQPRMRAHLKKAVKRL